MSRFRACAPRFVSPAVFLAVFLLGLAASAGSAANAQSAGGSARALDKSLAAVDRHAMAAPKAAERSIQSLAGYLAKGAGAGARGDLQKARAIYRWLTANIAYDAGAFFSGSFRNERLTAEDVLRTRKGVCDGYATLFEKLGTAAGLQVAKVSGYAKGFGYVPGQKIKGEPNHAWNAVKIAGRWRLVDATWGAGYVNGETRAFERRFQPHYFFPAPGQLIYDHLPENPRWQLLENQVSRREYENLPQLRPEFFQQGLGLQSHRQGLIEAGERLQVRLIAPRGVRLIASLYRGEKRLAKNLSYTRREGDGFRIHALFPKPGAYTLRFFANSGAAKGPYQWVMNYFVRAKKGTSARFPLFQPPFFAHGLKLESHPDGVIKAGERVEVSLLAPAGVRLLATLRRGEAKLPKNLTLPQRDGERYRIQAVFPAPGEYTLRLFSKAGAGAGNYDWALDYTVLAARGAGSAAGFPLTFSKFAQQGAFLHGPLRGRLKAGTRAHFKLRVPKASKVAVVIGKKWTQLKKSGDLFQGDVNIGKGKIGVFGNFGGGQGRYEGLLQYNGG